MANVHLLTATRHSEKQAGLEAEKHAELELEYLKDSAQRDRFGVHSVVDSPEEADIILFAERSGATGPNMEIVRQHPLVQNYREKVFVFNPRYKGFPYLPGVYASIKQTRYCSWRIRSSHYPEVSENGLFEHIPFENTAPYLFSFVGSPWTHPVRQEVMKLDRSRSLIHDSSQDNVRIFKAKEWGSEEKSYVSRYARNIGKSKFVLCPRGKGPATLRLFETMLIGRIPVIISDQWVAPKGPDWKSFSICIPENQVHTIPDVLEAAEPKAQDMAEAARIAWERWFSREVTFHRIVEWCLDIMGSRPTSDVLLRPLNPLTHLRATSLKLSAQEKLNAAKRYASKLFESVGNRSTIKKR